MRKNFTVEYAPTEGKDGRYWKRKTHVGFGLDKDYLP
jgi:hypothetical protein